MKITEYPELEFRLVETPEDMEDLIRFNAMIHDEEVGALTRELAGNHPEAGRMRWLVMIEVATGDIVSSLCLLPWTLLYEGIRIPAGEMGIVGTRKDWRKKGLVRLLAERFDGILRNEGYLISHIQGIPYFYRQFGYEYCVPLETQVYLEFRHIGTKGDMRLREAGDGDIKNLAGWYDEHVSAFGLSSSRSVEQWSYILENGGDTYIIEEDGRDAGFCRVPRQGFGDGMILGECSNLEYRLFPGLFARLAEMAREREKPFIRVNLGPTHPAVPAATDLGARAAGSYAWQIRIPEPAAFLSAIMPVLDGRLPGSEFATHSGELKINLYRSGVVIRIEDGKVSSVEGVESLGWGDIRIPPNLFAPLVLGQKSIDECLGFYPDLSGDARGLRLFTVLFPPVDAFFYCPY